VLLAGGFFFFTNFQVQTDDPNGPQIRQRDPVAGQGGGFQFPTLPPISGAPSTGVPARPANVRVSVPGQQALGGDMVRIAAFNIQVFGESKLAKPEVVEVLASIVRNFDIVAVEEIRDQQDSLVPNFLRSVNAAGVRYDYVIGPRLGRTNSKEQYAYLFNTDTIEVDRRTVYTVADPDDLLHREPLVASFRCRNADPQHAFTFTLVCIHTDPTPQTLRGELAVLDDVFRAVRSDPRGEDDVILLGDFNASARQMTELARMPNVVFAISGNLATNVAGNAQYDNLIFDRLATQEFNGRSGVFDFLRQYNLSQAQAKQVSDHLPVWAEFSVYEGGVAGRVATRPMTPPPSFRQPPLNPGYQGYQPQPNYQAQQGYQPYEQRYSSNMYDSYTQPNPPPGPRQSWDTSPQWTADPRTPRGYDSRPGYGPSYAPSYDNYR
jgi:endonuclease/exonuclease/phosphatase family metal-dependent hydrolase